MLDVAIVGGGLCGLALAHSLQANKGLNWALYEARERLGGRVLTAHSEAGTPVDLGATWFWPGHQPNITRLVSDLGLGSIAQPDDGRVLHLHDGTQPPKLVALQPDLRPAAEADTPAQPGAVHGGARRVVGGMARVIEALARPLPPAHLHLGHRLVSVQDLGSHLVLTLAQGEQTWRVEARRVVLTVPPRVLHAHVSFEPALAPQLQTALRDTPTWMATAAKAGYVYRQAFWRERGLTGNAWVTHTQAMLSETFDACGPAPTEGTPYPEAALAGFAALPAAQRPAFERGRPLLLESQVVQLFGEAAAHPDQQVSTFWQDWATEDTTCTALDIEEEQHGGMGHPAYGTPELAEPWWDGRLLLGSTETAQRGGGYLEGALGAAGRLRKQLLSGGAASQRPHDAANDARLATPLQPQPKGDSTEVPA